MSAANNPELLQSATTIVAAQLSAGTSPAQDVPAFIRAVYQTLRALDADADAGAAGSGTTMSAAPARAPAVPIDQSITRDHIVCLEDGKPLRMLKRYLMSQYGMTPDDYRRKWGLPADYPMMAPAVSDQRREAAVRNGLGKSAGGRG